MTARVFRVPEAEWMRHQEAAAFLYELIPKVSHHVWAQGRLEVEDSGQLVQQEESLYFIDDSLLMTVLTGRMEFRSFFCSSL